MRSALIVGAGIAGDTLAVLLGRAGWRVTVVEIAPRLRTGGQTVDLRGDSREVLDRLGLLDECLTRLVPQRGAAWIDETGRLMATMPVEAFDGQGYVSKEELLRTDLARVLHRAAAEHVTHWFGDTVDTLEPLPGGAVRATFRHHEPADYDLVVGADGTHSRVRSLTFGPEERYRRPLGFAHAWFTLTEQPGTPPLDGWFLICNRPGRLLVAARPGHPGRQEIGLSFPATELPSRRDPQARFALLEQVFAGAGWRTAEFLAAARTAEDFALDTYDQIVVEGGWHRGRTVLLGDSAWCASPLSGLGTALALQGAEALATAVLAGGPGALPDYERAMRPRVDAAQKLFPGRLAIYAPNTGLGIRAMTATMRAVQTPPVILLLNRLVATHGREPS
ncbi:FAD-dependent monooxygenase [Actinoplanes sp. NBRC 101535]|uniref:FAD-dependent monooxygenase n=1 Tax=Actinoplanes sp. NBRC 101535 TaxID=3032196 RepID=UPI0024A2D6AF|nr:FAD-dependent monooxygenase [Actinoplanes sp. NBRC 101535]GLY06522.1 monooxygenase [Actinoplanes sp. NBRC 101535]